jgi:hypothetical protein
VTTTRRRKWWPWVVAVVLALVFTGIGIVMVPILTHVPQGDPNQQTPDVEWPLEATARGDDGRERRIEILSVEPGGTVDTSALAPGDRFVVSGTGFDPARGIYVAICAIPDDPGTKPGPCLGGVPDQEAVEVAEGTVQFAASNWINDDWAWRLFGARSFDDRDTGTSRRISRCPRPPTRTSTAATWRARCTPATTTPRRTTECRMSTSPSGSSTERVADRLTLLFT